MRKMKMLVAFLVMLLMLTNGNTNIVKADGDNYTYCEVTENEVTKKVWLKNGEVIDGNPGTMEQMSNVTIEVTPDDNCAEYLETFDEPTVRVRVNPGVEVTFGSANTPASIQWLTCDNATVTVYAKSGEFAQNGSLPGSVYGVTTYNSNITFTGNIQYLCLGDEFKYDSDSTNKGTVTVTGNVYSLEWYKTGEYDNEGTQATVYYRGFKGDASVNGTVGTLTIREIKHSNVLDADLKADVGVGSYITDFKMNAGVLSSETDEKVEEITTDMEQFYYELCPQNYGWSKVARYPGGEETGVSKSMTDDEAKALLSTGTARIGVYSSGASVDLSEYNVAELKFERGIASAGSVTKPDGTGLLQITSYGKETIEADVTGDVDRFSISFTRYNPNMDINVGGKITEGHIYKGSLQSDFPIDLGTFSCEGMWIMKDGIWNPSLFLSLGKAEYHPVDDVTLDQVLSLTKEYTDQVTGHVLSEMADMVVTEMASGVLNGLTSNETFQTAVSGYKDATVLTGVEIELSKYKYNETTGVVTDKQTVTEIEGNDGLDFTVKIPGGHKEGKKYIIVREHEEGNTKTMDVLEPTQNGDKLTFKTNKFSSFTIVETDDVELEGDENSALKFATLSLYLQDNISVNYKINGAELVEAGYQNLRVKLELNGTETTITEYTIDNDKYVFEFADVAPQWINDTISATLYAELNGETVQSDVLEYSVAKYCYTVLQNYTTDEYANTRTLMVDLLNYGAAAQVYAEYKVDNLSNAALTDIQKSWASPELSELTSVLNSSHITIDNPSVTWKAVQLRLDNTVMIKYKIQTDSIDNLSAKIEVGNYSWTIPYTAFTKADDEGCYYIYIDGLSAGQMSEAVDTTIYNGDVAVSNTIRYSIESYVLANQNHENANLVDMLNKMLKYGYAAYNYAK